MTSAAERAGFERAKKAAHAGHAEAMAAPDASVDFATLFHTASDPNLPWPKPVEAWGAKNSANGFVLERIRSEVHAHLAGVGAPLVLTLIDEVLKGING